MQRDELERLSKTELIELVLRLQRPEKTSRTSSKPLSTEKRGASTPNLEVPSRATRATAGP